MTRGCHSVIPVVLFAALLVVAPQSARAQSFSEGFNSVPMLTGDDWVLNNMSDPLGATDWSQGDTLQFSAQAGPADSFIMANFENGSGVSTISNWLMSPERTFQTGDTISFWTRTDSGPVLFPDRLQVRLSLAGSSTDVGATATSVGDFTDLLLDINPTYATGGAGSYPTIWTQFTVPIPALGMPTAGRFAFRYFVENGGPAGNRSNIIGIDSVVYTMVPEPSTAALLLLGIPLMRRRRRRR